MTGKVLDIETICPKCDTEFTVTYVSHEHEAAEAERDRLLAQVQPAKGIPIIAEIHPHPDPVYGDCFQWPAQEINQFIEMSAADDAT